jgi:hypothetical protein
LRRRADCVKLAVVIPNASEEIAVALRLSSPAFAEGERIPALYSGEGEDLSPPLQWDGVPLGTRSFVLICNDPDAPVGTWYHWAIFDLPAATLELEAGFPTDGRVGDVRQAVTDFQRTGYGGPCPPRGHGVHRYRFRLMALDVEHLAVAASPDCRDVEAAAVPHILAERVLTGTYSRN